MRVFATPTRNALSYQVHCRSGHKDLLSCGNSSCESGIVTHLSQLFGLRKDFSVFHNVSATGLSVRTCPELLCFVSQLNTNLGPTANPPTTRAVTCRGVPWAKECSDVRVFSFSDEAGLRECLPQDRWGRARTFRTHLPSPNENER